MRNNGHHGFLWDFLFYIIFVYFVKAFKQCLLKTYLGEGDRDQEKNGTHTCIDYEDKGKQSDQVKMK